MTHLPISRMHVAARLEDRLNTVVGGWLTGRGWVPRVEPYTGYGAPGWVRVMARAVLAPPGHWSRGEPVLRGPSPGPTPARRTRCRARPAGPSPVRLSLIHISEPTRRTPISYAVFCL